LKLGLSIPLSTLYGQYVKAVVHRYAPGAKHRGYTKYIILGRSRTGSNFLRGMLSSHPSVLSYGEVFGNYDRIRGGLPSRPFRSSSRLLEDLRKRPIEYLNAHVFCEYRRPVEAVGFKIFYYHAQREGEWEKIWPYILGETEIRVIHLKRRSLLEAHVSRARAKASNQWFSYRPRKGLEQAAVRLDPDACESDFKTTREYEARFDDLLRAHDVCEVFYEDLRGQTTSEMDRIQGFLDVRSRVVRPLTHKQSSASLRNSIENYDELRERFADTEWSVFFPE
jgi:LPS sulfotransferase NodH